MSSAGSIVFDNLPLVFAMGVAIGMAKKEKEVSALAAVIAFFIMHASISAMIKIHGGTENLLEGASASVLGITSLQMGVFGGIRVGSREWQFFTIAFIGLNCHRCFLSLEALGLYQLSVHLFIQ